MASATFDFADFADCAGWVDWWAPEHPSQEGSPAIEGGRVNTRAENTARTIDLFMIEVWIVTLGPSRNRCLMRTGTGVSRTLLVHRAEVKRHRMSLRVAANQLRDLGFPAGARRDLKAVFAHRAVKVAEVAFVLVHLLHDNRLAIGAGDRNLGGWFQCFEFRLGRYRSKNLHGTIRAGLGGLWQEPGKGDSQGAD